MKPRRAIKPEEERPNGRRASANPAVPTRACSPGGQKRSADSFAALPGLTRPHANSVSTLRPPRGRWLPCSPAAPSPPRRPSLGPAADHHHAGAAARQAADHGPRRRVQDPFSNAQDLLDPRIPAAADQDHESSRVSCTLAIPPQSKAPTSDREGNRSLPPACRSKLWNPEPKNRMIRAQLPTRLVRLPAARNRRYTGDQ